MKVITYSEARRSFSRVLDTARKEKVFIKRRNGETFCLHYEPSSESPFDVPAVKNQVKTEDILSAVSDSRTVNTQG